MVATILSWIVSILILFLGLGLFGIAVLAGANEPVPGKADLGWILRLAAVAVATGVIFITMLVFSGKADAAELCGPYPVMKERLAERYGEVPAGGGMVTDAVVIQVMSAPDGATFTILSIEIDGRACVIATGQDWSFGKIPAAKTGTVN